jgi:hypothetical protein
MILRLDLSISFKKGDIWNVRIGLIGQIILEIKS